MKYCGCIALFLLLVALPTGAQVVHQEFQETLRAEVVRIEDEYTRNITGTGATTFVQEVEARITSGERKGDIIAFENDITRLGEGDRLFVNRLISIEGIEYYQFKDIDRRFALLWLAALLVIALVLFAGMQGVRALFSLLLSILAILFILVPVLLAGYPPVLSSIAIAGVVLALTLFITHGIRMRTCIAFVGTFSAVFVTGGMAILWVRTAHLTGFGSDASVYLNFSTGGSLDFSALLLGSIIIGMLGVLDDVAITQASVVQELKTANSKLGLGELYRRAIRVGRDHVSSLVNTLAFAYVGASLPLILLLARTDTTFGLMINQETVAAEIVRIIVGSIGLILAVPLSTLAAAWWYASHDAPKDISSHGHHHH